MINEKRNNCSNQTEVERILEKVFENELISVWNRYGRFGTDVVIINKLNEKCSGIVTGDPEMLEWYKQKMEVIG